MGSEGQRTKEYILKPYELQVKDRFCSAHKLDIPLSPCAALHGHTWEVQAFIQTESVGTNGVSVDFRNIKTYLRNICNGLDHCVLNDRLPFPPSAELLAKHVADELAKVLDAIGVRVDRVTVFEGEGTGVTYYRQWT